MLAAESAENLLPALSHGQLEKVVDHSKKLTAENEDLVKELNDAKSQLRKQKKKSEEKAARRAYYAMNIKYKFDE